MVSPINDDVNSTNHRMPILPEPAAGFGNTPRAAFTRRALNILGMGFVLAAAVLAFNSWSTVVVMKDQRHAFDQIQVGMKQEQVEAILGGPGEFRSIGGSQSVKLGPQGPIVSPMILELRWKDAYETVDIQFGGSAVENVTRHPREPLDWASIQYTRFILALLAIIGFAFLLEGLWTQRKPFSANKTSSVPPSTA